MRTGSEEQLAGERADREARVALQVGGFVPFTTVDYPERLSAVVFCQGCAWRCTYCHNPHLQPFCAGSHAWEDIVADLRKRSGFIDAVVFSGGEPTAQDALPAAATEVRAMGFAVGLHTAGMLPGRLAAVLAHVDWVGFDVKAPLDTRYDRVTRIRGSAARVIESLRILLASGVDYQLRTTLDPEHIDQAARDDILAHLKALGAPPPVWQPHRNPDQHPA
jgi:pyruvate formate lyase activating enzyme